MMKVEEKLYQNRYRIDTDRPHIKIRDAQVCNSRCATRQCVTCCPAACWSFEDGQIGLITDGCLECGTCRVVCDEFLNVDWNYPRAGFGILFKFG